MRPFRSRLLMSQNVLPASRRQREVENCRRDAGSTFTSRLSFIQGSWCHLSRGIAASLLLVCLTAAAAENSASLALETRARVRSSIDSNEWQLIEKTMSWEPKKTALVICDMWDRHWCEGATRRVAEMAPRMNDLVKKARAQGLFIIHCPSDTMKFYEGTPGRKLAQAAPPVTAKIPLQRWCSLDKAREAPLPIDDSDGGCDTDSPSPKGPPYPWSHQIDTIEIRDGDAITDSAEAYYLMQQRGIDNVIVMGVHLNMCVLGRPFSIRQMVSQGKNVLLLRDMTDTMYNPRRPPYVPHCVGTELMIEHVEKFWCPTISSVAFLGGAEFRFKEDQRPHVLFLIGDEEYKTGETVPDWARKELAWRGVRTTFVIDDPKQPATLAGLGKLPEADTLFLSLKRRALTPEQFAIIRKHLGAGKPLVGIRTASHAFGAQKPEPGRAAWDTFDRDVLGGHYENHYGKGPATLAVIHHGSDAHPIVTGLPRTEMKFASHLYKCRDLAPGTMVFLDGRVEGKPDMVEPLAWCYTNANHRAFYTSLGSPEDFKEPAFRRLLLNAVLWSIRAPIPPEEKAAIQKRTEAAIPAQAS
ncbi:MAG TPA: ThuA domain-containing protein, partial [Verrucomicrobiae bacterium]